MAIARAKENDDNVDVSFLWPSLRWAKKHGDARLRRKLRAFLSIWRHEIESSCSFFLWRSADLARVRRQNLASLMAGVRDNTNSIDERGCFVLIAISTVYYPCRW